MSTGTYLTLLIVATLNCMSSIGIFLLFLSRKLLQNKIFIQVAMIVVGNFLYSLNFIIISLSYLANRDLRGKSEDEVVRLGNFV